MRGVSKLAALRRALKSSRKLGKSKRLLKLSKLNSDETLALFANFLAKGAR